MNNIITTNTGGMPLKLEDINFLQTSLQDLTSHLADRFNQTAMILTGCEISVTNSGMVNPILVVTEGSLWYDGEIFNVVAQSDALTAYTTLDDVLTNYSWDLNVLTDTYRIFFNASSKKVYEYRNAIFTSTPTTWVDIDHLFTLDQVIKMNCNIDVINKEVEDPDDFTSLYIDGYSRNFRQYQVSTGQHICNWVIPYNAGDTYLNVIIQILPPADVYDGYLLTIKIRKNPDSNFTLAFTQLDQNTGAVLSNINLQTRLIASGTTELINNTNTEYGITFNTGLDNRYLTIYDDFSSYDINTISTGSFELKLVWDSNLSKWNELSRNKYSY